MSRWKVRRRHGSSMTPIILACCAAGALTVGMTMRNAPATVTSKSAPKLVGTEEYGRRLIAQTAALLGPDVPNKAMRYSGSRMACASCHLGAGTAQGTLTLMQTTEHYPRFSGRVGAKTDIEDRVNECMQRSMNGRPLPKDSAEMIAMAAYIRSLGTLNGSLGAEKKKVEEPPVFKTPNRAANLSSGKAVFEERCAACHGKDGAGLRASKDPASGYVFPPLWGPDSFNDGAGMHRVLTAARFVKARMPLGNPTLTDDQAFDVAAYFNSQPRPEMAGLDRDYPDRKAKPVDNTYGPFADNFSLDQHRYGPFGPIEEHYRKLKGK